MDACVCESAIEEDSDRPSVGGVAEEPSSVDDLKTGPKRFDQLISSVCIPLLWVKRRSGLLGDFLSAKSGVPDRKLWSSVSKLR